MTQFKIHASKEAGDGTANTLLHHHSIQTLKAKIQKLLRLGHSHPILISLIVQEEKIETLIMMECCQSDRMKIYSIKKAPDEIDDHEILGLEQKKKRPPLYQLSIKKEDIED